MKTRIFSRLSKLNTNIPISPELVRDAYYKFTETPVRRYYLLTTAEPNIDNIDAVDSLVREIHRRHGCEVIVNGILPSLKYYLRLLTDPKTFFKLLLEKS